MIEFKIESFFRQGAIFSDTRNVQLFWGDFEQTSQQPEGPAVYAPDFFLESAQPWYQFTNYEQVSTQQFIADIPRVQEFENQWQPPEPDLFTGQFNLIKKWIAEKRLQKCVPVVFGKCSFNGELKDLLAHVLHSALKGHGGYIYGLWNESEFIFGRTPEILLTTKDSRHWQSAAVAGTVASADFEANPEQFLNDDKENHEHQLVCEFLQKTLARFGQVKLASRITRDISGLTHLYTPVELITAQPVDLLELIRGLHPTPALGSYPQEQWQQVFSECSQRPRGRFGAPIGWSNGQRSDIYVAIRNMQKISNSFVVGSGCGVVAQSDLHKEWQELLNKQTSTLRMLGL